MGKASSVGRPSQRYQHIQSKFRISLCRVVLRRYVILSEFPVSLAQWHFRPSESLAATANLAHSSLLRISPQQLSNEVSLRDAPIVPIKSVQRLPKFYSSHVVTRKSAKNLRNEPRQVGSRHPYSRLATSLWELSSPPVFNFLLFAPKFFSSIASTSPRK